MLSFMPMKFSWLFLVSFFCLCVVGAWGVQSIYFSDSRQSPAKISSQAQTSKSNLELDKLPTSDKSLYPTPLTALKSETPNTESITQLAIYSAKIEEFLSQHQPGLAAEYIQSLYSQLSSSEIDSFRRLFYTQAQQYTQPNQQESLKQLYIVGAELFSDADLWDAATYVSEQQKDWSGALRSQRRSTSLESRPDILETKLFKLVTFASQLRAYHEALDDELGIRAVYKELYEEHPNYPRFQLELAQSYLRLGDTNAALPLLTILQYDPDLGELAKQSLDRIEASLAFEPTPTKRVDPDSRPADIIVPLRRIGSSLGVDTSIGGRSITLLLDTGASITALSKDLIQSLKLAPTGDVIRLNTANGVTTSRLFKAEKLRLGRVYIEEAVIAEINLQSASPFQGLLGTDLLNRVNPKYSYVIDNSKSALIFRRKL